MTRAHAHTHTHTHTLYYLRSKYCYYVASSYCSTNSSMKTLPEPAFHSCLLLCLAQLGPFAFRRSQRLALIPGTGTQDAQLFCRVPLLVAKLAPTQLPGTSELLTSFANVPERCVPQVGAVNVKQSCEPFLLLGQLCPPTLPCTALQPCGLVPGLCPTTAKLLHSLAICYSELSPASFPDASHLLPPGSRHSSLP